MEKPVTLSALVAIVFWLFVWGLLAYTTFWSVSIPITILLVTVFLLDLCISVSEDKIGWAVFDAAMTAYLFSLIAGV